MNLNSRNSLFGFYAIVNIVSVFIPVYRNGGKAKTQTMARTRQFYFIFFFCTSVCEIATATNYFTQSKNFRHSTRTKTSRCFVFKMKNVSLFQYKSAILRFTINYLYIKSPIFNNPFLHLLFSFAVLSEEMSILLISSAKARSLSKSYSIKFVLLSKVSQ